MGKGKKFYSKLKKSIELSLMNTDNFLSTSLTNPPQQTIREIFCPYNRDFLPSIITLCIHKLLSKEIYAIIFKKIHLSNIQPIIPITSSIK